MGKPVNGKFGQGNSPLSGAPYLNLSDPEHDEQLAENEAIRHAQQEAALAARRAKEKKGE